MINCETFCKIYDCHDRQGLTIAQIARALGLHPQTVATWVARARFEGEWVHRLQPLDVPPSSATLTAAEALAYSAIELFTERAMASLDSFEFSDADASIVADLCRRLDGIIASVALRPRHRWVSR